MKKIALILLVCSGYAHAAAAGSPLAEAPTIELYNNIVAPSYTQAETEAAKKGQKLTGTVPRFYRNLKNNGGVEILMDNPLVVAKAQKLLSVFENTEMFYGDAQDAIEQAQKARHAAMHLSDEASQEERLGTWSNELKTFSIALITLLKREAPEGFVASSTITERILANNGLELGADHEVALGGGTLAVLAGFDQRRKAMGPELFGKLVKGLLTSRAHETIASIDVK